MANLQQQKNKPGPRGGQYLFGGGGESNLLKPGKQSNGTRSDEAKAREKARRKVKK
jgi:hypothetical protein